MKHTAYLGSLATLILSLHIPMQGINPEQKGPEWRKYAFNYVYNHGVWNEKKENIPLSGYGSTLEATQLLRALLPSILKAIEAETVLDAGCGDFTWMQKTPIQVKQYIGVDIVESVIATNQQKYKNEVCSFYCADVTVDTLPKVDLILCRDCFAHLSFEDIKAAIKNFKKSGSTYLLTTDYTNIRSNTKDIASGFFRPINLRAYPFSFPIPVMLFRELTSEKEMNQLHKCIVLWRLEDIEIE